MRRSRWLSILGLGLLALGVAACGDTWRGLKQDTGENLEAVGKTVGQIVLRWHIQIGAIIFPKSTKPERMRENFEIFNFELSTDQMQQIEQLDRGSDGRTGGDPATFDLVPGG